MGRLFQATHHQDELSKQRSKFTKPYKSLFCLKCFNKQSQVLNIENLWKCANSSYGIPISCFKTLSHLHGPCKEFCYVDRDTSTQHLNLLKLTKFFKLSEEQKNYWCQRTNAVISYRDIRVKDLSVTSHESRRLAEYRSAVLESTLINNLSQTIDVTYTTGIEHEWDEEAVRQRDSLMPSRTNIWSRIRQRLWTQMQRARQRQQSWQQTALSSAINEQLIIQEMTRIHSNSRETRREELEELLQRDEEDILNDQYYPR